MRPVLPLLLLAAALVLSGCAKPAGTSTPTGNSTNSTMNMGPAEDVMVTVGDATPAPQVGVPPGITQYTISPAKLELKLNHMYNLTLKNAGRAAHDLVIPDLGVKIANVAAGASSPPTMFTANQTGTFDMYCTLGGGPTAAETSHKDHGMKGQVVVS